jgi:hypothetical protein
LTRRYLDTGRTGIEVIDSTIYEQSKAVQREIERHKREVRSAVRRGKLPSDRKTVYAIFANAARTESCAHSPGVRRPPKGRMLHADKGNERLQKVNNRFWLQSYSTRSSPTISTKFVVTDCYEFEPFRKGLFTVLDALGQRIRLEDGLSEYLTRIGLAKTFTYESSWIVDWCGPADSNRARAASAPADVCAPFPARLQGRLAGTIRGQLDKLRGTSGTLVFNGDVSLNHLRDDSARHVYRVTGGSVTWTATYEGRCTGEVSGSSRLAGGRGGRGYGVSISKRESSSGSYYWHFLLRATAKMETSVNCQEQDEEGGSHTRVVETSARDFVPEGAICFNGWNQDGDDGYTNLVEFSGSHRYLREPGFYECTYTFRASGIAP